MPAKKSKSVRKTKDTSSLTTSSSPPCQNASVESKTPSTLRTTPQRPSTSSTKNTTTPISEGKRSKSTSPVQDVKPKPTAAPPRSFCGLVAAALGLIVLAGAFFLLSSKGSFPMEGKKLVPTTACSCLREASYSRGGGERKEDSSASRLAGCFLSSYAPLTGVHARSDAVASVLQALDFVRPCGVVVSLTTPIKDLEELQEILQRPFLQGSCVVWVAEVGLLGRVLNPLKELFEDNTLRGVRIAPPLKKGFLVLVSDKSREDLKEDMPHRVVHMLNTVEL